MSTGQRTLSFTKSFVRDYQHLPADIQAAVDRALELLLMNPRHPSLQVKKMQPKTTGIYEGRVTQGYRFTFEWHEDQLPVCPT